MNTRHLSRLPLLLALLLLAACKPTPKGDRWGIEADDSIQSQLIVPKAGALPITGTFLDEISHDIPHQNWGEKEWDRDFRYMKNELGAPLAYDKKLHGWHYTRPFKLPSEGFSDDEILYLNLIRGLVNQNSNDDFLYKSFDKLLNKITPDKRDDEKKTLKQVQGDGTQHLVEESRYAEESCHAELVSASIQARFYIAPRPKQLIDEGVVEKVLEAIKNNYLLDFNYFSKWEPEERHRKIMPFQLVFDGGSMFLYGAGIKNPENPRLFKLSKMHDVQVITFRTFELPAGFRFHEDFEKGRFHKSSKFRPKLMTFTFFENLHLLRNLLKSS